MKTQYIRSNTGVLILTIIAITAATVACTSAPKAESDSADAVSTWVHQLNNEMHGDLSLAQIEAEFNRGLKGEYKRESQALAKHLMKVAKEQQLSPSVVLAVIKAESTFRVKARSKVGALGLMQIKPSTAKYMADKRGIAVYKNGQDLYNPYINITVGVHYLAYLRGKFDSSLHYIAAYNLGPTSVKRMVNKKQFALGKVEKYVREIHSDARKMRRASQTDTYVSYNR